MEIKNVLVKDIKYAPYNPRKISDEVLNKLKKSIEEFGYIEPIIVNKRSMHVVGGNQRLKVLRQLDIKEVQSVIVDLDDTHEKALNIALNKINGEWDLPLLKDLLLEIDTGEIDIELTGFDMPEIEELMNQFHIEGEEDNFDVDKATEETGTPTIKNGEIWLLGKHRLMCGDATKKENVEKLVNSGKTGNIISKGLNTRRVDKNLGEFIPEIIAIIDPPYGINVVKEGKIGGGNICEVGNYKNIIGDKNTKTAKEGYELLKQIGIEKIIIWGGNYFTDFLPPSPCWIIWDKKGDMESNNFADCELAWTSFKTPARVFRCIWRGMIKQGEHNKRLHPTQKPIKMLVDVLNKFTKEDDVVIDLFLGSGSTLIACEQTKRVCYGMEIDPVYCDVIVKRWEEYTGKKAELLR